MWILTVQRNLMTPGSSTAAVIYNTDELMKDLIKLDWVRLTVVVLPGAERPR